VVGAQLAGEGQGRAAGRRDAGVDLERGDGPGEAVLGVDREPREPGCSGLLGGGLGGLGAVCGRLEGGVVGDRAGDGLVDGEGLGLCRCGQGGAQERGAGQDGDLRVRERSLRESSSGVGAANEQTQQLARQPLGVELRHGKLLGL